MLSVMRCSMRTSLRGKRGFFILQSFLPFFAFSVSWPLVPHGQLSLRATGSLAHQSRHTVGPRLGTWRSACFLHLTAPDLEESNPSHFPEQSSWAWGLSSPISLRLPTVWGSGARTECPPRAWGHVGPSPEGPCPPRGPALAHPNSQGRTAASRRSEPGPGSPRERHQLTENPRTLAQQPPGPRLPLSEGAPAPCFCLRFARVHCFHSWLYCFLINCSTTGPGSCWLGAPIAFSWLLHEGWFGYTVEIVNALGAKTLFGFSSICSGSVCR